MTKKTIHKVNPRIQQLIEERVLEHAKEEQREPSGRLAPSRLGWPLQWQMLHYYKVPQKQHDEFTLRKFARGNDVEHRIVEWLGEKFKTQIPVSYRGVQGIMDLMMEYPIEIKSCTNAAFKHRQKEGPSRSHQLQAKFYAKATGHEKCGVAYTASDDYRVLCFEVAVDDEVDKLIDRYERQVENGSVPEFEPEENWQAIRTYNPYPEWASLNKEEIADKLASLGIAIPMKLPLTS